MQTVELSFLACLLQSMTRYNVKAKGGTSPLESHLSMHNHQEPKSFSSTFSNERLKMKTFLPGQSMVIFVLSQNMAIMCSVLLRNEVYVVVDVKNKSW